MYLNLAYLARQRIMYSNMYFRILSSFFILSVSLMVETQAQSNVPMEVLFNITYDHLNQSQINGTYMDLNILQQELTKLYNDPQYTQFFQGATVPQVIERLLSANVFATFCVQGTYAIPGDSACTPCPLGTYSLTTAADTSAVCLECPAGTYSTTPIATTASVCASCPADTYSTLTGMSALVACQTCPSNSKSPASTSSLAQCKCDPGYYRILDTCIPCTSNSFCDNEVQSSCPANSYSPAISDAIADCVCNNGYYRQGDLCMPCTADSFCTNNAQTQCPAHTSSNPLSSSSTHCICNSGYFFDSESSVCTPCAAGYYKNAISNDVCIACPAGTAVNTQGSTSITQCNDCTAGQYSAQGSVTCPVCTNGYYSNSKSETCTMCPAGTYQTGTPGSLATCSFCPTGTFSTTTAATNSNVCTTCQDGYTSAAGSTACTQCNANQYSVNGGTCSQCPANSFAPTAGSHTACVCSAGFRRDTSVFPFQCVPCETGTYGLDGVTCTDCSAGTYQGQSQATTASACIECAAGEYSPTKSASCSLCTASTYSPAAMSPSCTPCAIGFYSSTGSSQCTSCNLGTYSTMALSSMSQCTPCPRGYYCLTVDSITQCPEGTYSGVTNKYTDTCSACPANSFCPKPWLELPCPSGTVSVEGVTSMLGCTCTKGVSCAYKKVVEVVLSMNISASTFAQSDIQDSFINAVATAAHVSPENVFLSKVVNKNDNTEVDVSKKGKSQGQGQNRRLLVKKLRGSANNKNKQVVERGIHISVRIEDADHVADLDHHLKKNGLPKSSEHAWYAPHSVTVSGANK